MNAPVPAVLLALAITLSMGTATFGQYMSGFGSSSPGSYSPSIIGPTVGSNPSAEQRKLYAECEATLKHLDTNRNGIIEPNELEGGKSPSHKELYETMMTRAGLPATVPMPVAAIRERLVAVYHITNTNSTSNSTTSSKSSSSSSSSTSIAAATPSMVPGFGTPAGFPPVPGFGITPVSTITAAGSGGTSSSRSGSTSVSSSASTSKSSGPPEMSESKAREIATIVMKKFDKNQNGVLEKEEASNLRDDPKLIDRNRDGIITVDELTAFFFNRSRGGSASPPSSSSSSVPGQDSSRKAWRFLSPQERLPKGLPDWFTKKDVDGDGQVTMAEFSSEWNDKVLRDFARYDLDNDGVITAAECLKAIKDAADVSRR